MLPRKKWRNCFKFRNKIGLDVALEALRDFWLLAHVYGPAAVLKNAIYWVYAEWNRKAAAFVSYGGAMEARSVQHLREVATEVKIAPIRSSVHIPVATFMAIFRRRQVTGSRSEHAGTTRRLSC